MEINLFGKIGRDPVDLFLDEDGHSRQDSRLLSLDGGTLHGVSLAGASLSVGEDAHILTIQGRLHERFDFLEDFLLSCLGLVDFVEVVHLVLEFQSFPSAVIRVKWETDLGVVRGLNAAEYSQVTTQLQNLGSLLFGELLVSVNQSLVFSFDFSPDLSLQLFPLLLRQNLVLNRMVNGEFAAQGRKRIPLVLATELLPSVFILIYLKSFLLWLLLEFLRTVFESLIQMGDRRFYLLGH